MGWQCKSLKWDEEQGWWCTWFNLKPGNICKCLTKDVPEDEE